MVRKTMRFPVVGRWQPMRRVPMRDAIRSPLGFRHWSLATYNKRVLAPSPFRRTPNGAEPTVTLQDLVIAERLVHLRAEQSPPRNFAAAFATAPVPWLSMHASAIPRAPHTMGCSAWVDLPGVGTIRSNSRPMRGPKAFDVDITFPNLTTLHLELDLNANGELEPLLGNKHQFTDRYGRQNVVTDVHRVSGHNMQIAVELTHGEAKDRLVLTFQHEGTHQRLILTDVDAVLSPSSVRWTEALAATIAPIQRSPSVLAVIQTGGIGTKDTRYHLPWTNGDTLVLALNADHHGCGEFTIKSARVHQLATGIEHDLIFPGSAMRGGNTVTFDGGGYKITGRITPPSGGSGTIVTFTNFKMIIAPEVLAATVDLIEKSLFHHPHVRPAKGMTLVPTATTAELLRNPPWDRRGVTLTFIGTVGGLPIDPNRPIEVDGEFEAGAFVPGRHGTRVAHGIATLQTRGADDYLTIEFTRDPDGTLQAAAILSHTDRIRAEGHSIAGILGFSDDADRLAKRFHRAFLHTVPIQRVPAVTSDAYAWVGANDEQVAEVMRVFDAATIDWTASVPVGVATGSAHILRMTLHDDVAILLQRREEGHEVVFRVAAIEHAGRGDDAKIQWVELGHTQFLLVGLEIDGEPVKPWRGEMFEASRRSGSLEFRDPQMPSASSTVVHGQELSLRVPKELSPMPMTGVLARQASYANDAVIFTLADGRRLWIAADNGYEIHDVLMHLADEFRDALDEDDREMTFGFELLRPDGAVTQRGQIGFDDARLLWILRPDAGTDPALSLRLNTETAYAPTIKLDEPPAAVVHLPRVEPERPTFPKALPAHPPEVIRFPWAAGAFLLPSSKARKAMARMAHPPRMPHNGTKETFEFYGEPHGGETSSQSILSAMELMGSTSSVYYGWIVRIDMAVHDGAWVPDGHGQLHVVRNATIDDGKAAHAADKTFYRKTTDDAFPMRDILVQRDGFAFAVDERQQRLETFRTALPATGYREVPGAWFGLSLGPPTDDAVAQLTGVETFLRRFKPTPRLAPRRITTALPVPIDGHLVDVPVWFGDPVFRTPIEDGHGFIELAPGYSHHYAFDRFSRLRYRHGGEQIDIYLHHEAAGNTTRMAKAVVNDLVVPSEWVLHGRNRDGSEVIEFPAGEWPTVVSWLHTPSGHLQFRGIYIGLALYEFPPEARFELAEWGQRYIETAREARELSQSITRTVRTLPQRPPIPRLQVHGDLTVWHPSATDRARLARGQAASGAPLRGATWIDLQGPDAARSVSVAVEWNGYLETYVPAGLEQRIDTIRSRRAMAPERIRVRIGGVETWAHVVISEESRSWRITLPDETTFLAANFYVHETGRGGRPVPMAWIDPKGRGQVRMGHVTRWLETEDLTPATVNIPMRGTNVQRRTQKVGDDARLTWWEFTLTDALPEGHPLRSVPFRLIRLGTRDDESVEQRLGVGKWLVLPMGPVHDGASGHNLDYFKRRGGQADVVRIQNEAWRMGFHPPSDQVRLNPIHPGRAVLGDARLRQSAEVRGHGEGHTPLLLDFNATAWDDAVAAATTSQIHRVLFDGLSADLAMYDLVVARNGRRRVGLAGMARWTADGTADVVADKVLYTAEKCYVLLTTGEYLSFSTRPGTELTVTAHGRVLGHELVARKWEDLDTRAQAALFTEPPKITLANGAGSGSKKETSSRPYSNRDASGPAARQRDLDLLVEATGLPPAVLWDLVANEYPRGARWYSRKQVDGAWVLDQQADGRLLATRSTNPLLAFVMRSLSATNYGELTVLFGEDRGALDNATIPHSVMRGLGRNYILLGGPLAGAVFYVDDKRNVTELTHPALIERMLTEQGITPAARIKPRGDQWAFPEFDEPAERAIQAHLGRTRTDRFLWRLAEAGTLPRDTDARQAIFEALIPDWESAPRPVVLQILEALTTIPTGREAVRTFLDGLHAGHHDTSQFDSSMRETFARYQAEENPDAKRAILMALIEDFK